MADRPQNWNQNIIDEFRANDGTVTTAGFGGRSCCCTTSARTGQERVCPAVGIRQDPDTWLVAASKAGAPDNPAWFHNLQAHPEVSIEVPGEGTVAVRRACSTAPSVTRVGAVHRGQPGVRPVRGAHDPHHPGHRPAPPRALSRGCRPAPEAGAARPDGASAQVRGRHPGAR